MSGGTVSGSPPRAGRRPAETLTNPKLAHRPDAGSFRLAPGLAERYELESQLPKQGGEAVLLLVHRNPAFPGPGPGADTPAPSDADSVPVQYVLKVYARELGVRSEVLQLLSGADEAHVVRLHDYGTAQGLAYELLEYVHGGDLDEHVARNGPLSEDLAVKAVAELTEAIECLHTLGRVPLAYGDLKPANVLIRTLEPFDLVLADFGMATLDHHRVSEVRGTRLWSAPLSLAGYVRPEGDWWSLGAVAYWLRTGKPLMSHLISDDSEESAVTYLHQHNADLSDLPDGDTRDWGLLCRGLLVRESHERWGAAQVRRWLAGESPEVGSQWAEPEPIVIEIPAPTNPITIGGGTYLELAELGLALASDWDGSRALVAERADDLITVLGEHGRQTKDLDLRDDVADILAADESADLRLSRLIRRLAPAAPPAFASWQIDAEALAGLADRGAANPDSPEAAAVSRLFTEHVMAAWDLVGDAQGTNLDQVWQVHVDDWNERVRSHSADVGEALVRRARSSILLALLRPSHARELTKDARHEATDRARSIDWFHELADGIGRDPAQDFAVICLASEALAQANAIDLAKAAAREAEAAERAAASRIRVPRTRRVLGWCLLAQAVLVGTTLWLRVLAPRSWLGMLPGQALTWWSELPGRVANWVTWWTDPWIIVPLFAVSALLYARARATGPAGSDGSRATITRPGLERRAMQAAIALTCLLVPPLIPLGLYGWWRGLQFYSPDAIRGRDPLRTLAMGGGLAGATFLVGLVVGVWPSPLALSVSEQYQQWAAAPAGVTALAGPITAVGALAGGIPAQGWALVVTVLVGLAGPVLVVLAARSYAVAEARLRRAMGVLVLVGLLAVGTLPLAYLPEDWGYGAAAATAVWVGSVVMRGRGSRAPRGSEET